VVSQAELISTFSAVTGVLTVFLGAIAAISLLVGGIGIMNIMLVSVTERTREIGLRKAIGATSRAILGQFLAEAIFLSLVGGVIGIVIGIGGAYAITLLSSDFKPIVQASAIALAVGFSFSVGLFFGIYPARRAARLNPIDALRYE
jgi:putative ABC transport system permease protein